MTEIACEIFIHIQGRAPKVVAAKGDQVLRDVLLGAELAAEEMAEMAVFIGECQDALAEPEDHEDGADVHAEIDINLTVEALELHHRKHVHCHKCRLIAIEVNFGGKTKGRKFSPAATIETVTVWARKKFRLDPASSAEYVLQICGTTDRPRPNQHLGEVASPETCAACFDLVKEETPQG